MSMLGGLHSALKLASAFALAWHSADTIGGVTSPSQRPSHMTIAFASALHEARAAPSQPPIGSVLVHSPEQLPMHIADAFISMSHEPVQVPSQVPSHSPMAFIRLQVPLQPPLQVPLQSAAAEPSSEQVPLHS